MKIRATHVDRFRSGEWATVLRTEWANEPPRACFVVEFDDGVTDLWPVQDPWDPYEFQP